MEPHCWILHSASLLAISSQCPRSPVLVEPAAKSMCFMQCGLFSIVLRLQNGNVFPMYVARWLSTRSDKDMGQQQKSLHPHAVIPAAQLYTSAKHYMNWQRLTTGANCRDSEEWDAYPASNVGHANASGIHFRLPMSDCLQIMADARTPTLLAAL